jgi:nitroreductase
MKEKRMELYEAIEKRRTVRTFTRPASEAALKRIVLAGSKAASAGGRQPWEFVVVDDANVVDQIATAKYKQNLTIQYANATEEEIEARAIRQRNAYNNCSVVAVCCVDDEEDLVGAWMAVQNMYLAATAEGLGIVPSTFWGRHQKKVGKLLGVPEDYSVATVCLIGVQEGYPDNFGEPRRPRRPESSWLHHNSF